MTNSRTVWGRFKVEEIIECEYIRIRDELQDKIPNLNSHLVTIRDPPFLFVFSDTGQDPLSEEEWFLIYEDRYYPDEPIHFYKVIGAVENA